MASFSLLDRRKAVFSFVGKVYKSLKVKKSSLLCSKSVKVPPGLYTNDIPKNLT